MKKLSTLFIQNGIAVVTLNHTEKNNILCEQVRQEIVAHYLTCENDPTVKIIILHANGKHFCAGADMHEMLTMSNASFDDNLLNAKNFAQFFYRIYMCQKPTICCTQGKTMGGGVGLLAAHDITIAIKTAEFCFPEVKLGIFPAIIAPFVTHRIGFSSAQTLMLSTEIWDAKRAHEIKLIDYLCDEKPINTALLLAEKMLNNNLIGMQTTKKWLRELCPITSQQLEQAAQLLANIRSTTEARTCFKNYLNKHSAN